MCNSINHIGEVKVLVQSLRVSSPRIAGSGYERGKAHVIASSWACAEYCVTGNPILVNTVKHEIFFVNCYVLRRYDAREPEHTTFKYWVFQRIFGVQGIFLFLS